ncbi:hypothetical protein JGU71_08200 [Antrihabitans sp. YC3-6]|uniref:Uncharacterized protein n=1 Tax=Antrihabitans stalagmiti TaxID=2799499 RepID=A0A934U2E7_9NOCA|nr:hypothetical protein [Antrihabitans stalagmiti]MBJ8338866.1 hypothetical protein [Antrihabitans stalagmiti]
MPGKGIDRNQTRSALETIKDSPTITLIALSPAIVLFALVWWIGGLGWAVLALIALGVLGVVGVKYLR